FKDLYDSVKDGRNDAMHHGAYARHLTDHAVQVALIIEDALMTGKDRLSDYMVRNVIQASLWQPLSFVRQQMLSNSFSYIPFLNENDEWSFLCDRDIAKYINQNSKNWRKEKLANTVKQAINDLPNKLNFDDAISCKPDNSIGEALELMKEKPLIVTDTNDKTKIIGIITAFDLL
ncbi:MAG: CBS domain-containing protein, partial [Pseudanabaena sp.]